MTSLEPERERRQSPGQPHPLGATLGADGVNFALFSRHATQVELLLFDRIDGPPSEVIRLEHRTRFVFHAFVHGIRAGQLYGYKVRGPFKPARGMRFNEHKLLLDPYAKAFSGKAHNRDNLLLAYDPGSRDRDLSLDTRDNTPVMPKCIVIDDRFDWQGDQPPAIPFEQLVIYEVHLKGYTAHPSARVEQPGSYLGFIEKIPHLVELGVNAVEFLPLHERHVGDFLFDKGLTNYWGYDSIGFFAPESAYRAGVRMGGEVDEFKTLVRELHRAGIEVILDVVYNHTGEGSELGPTLSFRGIDNPSYYALTGPAEAPGRYYMNWSGCGNSLDMSRAPAMRLVMDSLRYWVEAMHVDGFRFDLASILGREGGHFEKAASFFDVISQDPVLSRAKLIAEPWDLGTYQVGQFPVDWSEWNGRFRDNLRKFGKGDAGQLAELGYRLTGSADLYGDDGRSPYNTVNFVTCHDGFTLWDLVSYNQKHNEANGEDNRDGSNDNHSWNCGVEGETDEPAVLDLRMRLARNFVCYLFFSAGTPMLLGGDEMLRTQRGNNNAYCQDNAISWFDWTLVEKHRPFLEFVKKAIRFSRRYPVLRRRTFFTGRDQSGDDRPDIHWYGEKLDAPRWDDPESRLLAYQLDGAEADHGVGSYLLFVVLNSDWRDREVHLPDPGQPSPEAAVRRWYRVVDTSLAPGEDFADEGYELRLEAPQSIVARGRSTVVLLAR
jgi:glycogen operon protein